VLTRLLEQNKELGKWFLLLRFFAINIQRKEAGAPKKYPF